MKFNINFFSDMGVVIALLAVVFMCVFGMVLIYDTIYVKPIAADKATNICIDKGFTYAKDFKRFGLLSETPIAISCEYSNKYQVNDIYLHKTIEG